MYKLEALQNNCIYLSHIIVAFYLHLMNYTKPVEIRWSDLDPNFHLRHSVYYDFGAYCRVSFLIDNGITPEVMTQHFIGPILFKEECIFKREIKFGDNISINLKLKGISANGKKWIMTHDLLKNNETVCAIITIEGAWMNTQLRKIIAPPQIFMTALEGMPKTEDFRML